MRPQLERLPRYPTMRRPPVPYPSRTVPPTEHSQSLKKIVGRQVAEAAMTESTAYSLQTNANVHIRKILKNVLYRWDSCQHITASAKRPQLDAIPLNRRNAAQGSNLRTESDIAPKSLLLTRLPMFRLGGAPIGAKVSGGRMYRLA